MLIKATVFGFILLSSFHVGYAVLTDCVVQAFGTGLSGKGIKVRVNSNGFHCPGFYGSPKPVEKEKKFDSSGEAEVPLRLHVGPSGICMQSLKIWVTLRYPCDKEDRLVTQASWAGTGGGQGSCRALEQRCGGRISTAAVPYIDMWCRTPPGMVFAGKAQEMRMTWAFPTSKDKC